MRFLSRHPVIKESNQATEDLDLRRTNVTILSVPRESESKMRSSEFLS